MKDSDYISGPHHFWTHFWCGLVFGGGLGLWGSVNILEGPTGIALGTAATALLVAYACGRWGDAFWRWLIEALR